MDSRVIEFRTAAIELSPYDWYDDKKNHPKHYIPMSRFKDLITEVPYSSDLLYDYQLNVVKDKFVEHRPGRRAKLYSTQDSILTHVLAHYLNEGPNGKAFDDTPWMDDPLPVLHQHRDGWRIIDGHHRLIAAGLLNVLVYCAVAEAKPEHTV